MSKYINLTAHDINILVGSGSGEDGVEAPIFTTITPSGVSARVGQDRQIVRIDGEFILSRVVNGEVQDLPSSEAGTMLIVSAQVRQALPSRKDLVSPGELIRDERGVVIGCRNFDVNL